MLSAIIDLPTQGCAERSTGGSKRPQPLSLPSIRRDKTAAKADRLETLERLIG
jgi:hypothetical protein